MPIPAKDPISRAFRQDFPQFVERAKALGVRISLSPGKRNGAPRTFWLDGYRQLTGYSIRKDGSPFTHEDAVLNIDRALSEVEEDRRAIAAMTPDQRFARVMVEFRKMIPQARMIGEVRLPGGDGGGVFFLADYHGEAQLFGLGTVAKANAAWRRGVGAQEQMAAFCDLLEQDYARRKVQTAPLPA
jgi:hypothetical protein